MSPIALRPVESTDLDAILQQTRDPESVRMAALTPEDPSDRSAFDAHMAKVMSSAEGTLRAITRDDRLVGTIASYVSEGETEVTYWIDRLLGTGHREPGSCPLSRPGAGSAPAGRRRQR
jgi:RimJ/RimL family protein N-acetyltransferase